MRIECECGTITKNHVKGRCMKCHRAMRKRYYKAAIKSRFDPREFSSTNGPLTPEQIRIAHCMKMMNDLLFMSYEKMKEYSKISRTGRIE